MSSSCINEQLNQQGFSPFPHPHDTIVQINHPHGPLITRNTPAVIRSTNLESINNNYIIDISHHTTEEICMFAPVTDTNNYHDCLHCDFDLEHSVCSGDSKACNNITVLIH